MSTDETAVATVTPAAAAPSETAPQPEPLRNVTKNNPVCTVGRRKKAHARIRVWPGDGKITVNGRPVEEYFKLTADRAAARRPLDVSSAATKYEVSVQVQGGGSTGQADAVSLAIARALIRLEPAVHRALRDAGLLTRDARVKERKKYGRRGARRGFQFSKR